MSEQAVSRIVDATGVPLRKGVQLDGLRAAIDRLVNEVTVLSLSRDPRGARRELQRLKRAFEAYSDLADTLPALDLFPPKPPADWRAAVTLWIKNTEADQKAMTSQTRSNALAEFYPRAMGLGAREVWIERNRLLTQSPGLNIVHLVEPKRVFLSTCGEFIGPEAFSGLML
jgi:hypothetical protein